MQDVYLDPADGEVRYIAVETGWFGGACHVVPMEGITARGADPDKDIILPHARERLSEAPTYRPEHELTLQDESDVQEFYGLESYREIVRARQNAPAPTPEIAEAELMAAIRSGGDPGSVQLKRWGV